MAILMLLLCLACGPSDLSILPLPDPCPTMTPEILWPDSNATDCYDEELLVEGEGIFTGIIWLPETGEADAVRTPDLSALPVQGELSIWVEFCPSEVPITGALRLTTEEGCVLTTWIEEE